MAKPAKTRYFSLRTDVEPLLRERWLRPGERLLDFRPVEDTGTAPGLRGFSPPRTAGQRFLRVLGYIGLALLFVLIVPILVYALEGLGGAEDDTKDSRKRRPLYAWGDGAGSAAAQAVLPTLRCTGVWVLTDQRLAFVAVQGKTTLTAPHETGEADRLPRPVEIETPVALPSHRYAYEGKVERTRTTALLRREKPVGTYHRIAFADGSGIDMRHRYPPAVDPMARFKR
ncbi:hypothetical protein LO763_02150 [Glycomyces sp. A-F 0318]|uniref:hypothetical protein n=1 Tax=Glycomyces amatae TaxID=2881355 RepID=UPI001E3839E4|nr:hypothetical protein [Glycomyces amatae]MCD0442426.1 hypothetical protein [Glycomyces amatae]